MLDFVSIYKESIDFFSMQYHALLNSARNEMGLMAYNFNSRVLSRIGFVTQEMMDLHFVTLNDIRNRANQIGSNDTDCIVEAERNLEASLATAGDVIMTSSVRTTADLAEIYDYTFHHVIHDIDFIVSFFDVEILALFAYMNSVTSMFPLLILLETEIRAYGALFEYFVDEVHVEMMLYSQLTSELSAAVFPQLDAGLEAFRTTGNSIRNSLVTCN